MKKTTMLILYFSLTTFILFAQKSPRIINNYYVLNFPIENIFDYAYTEPNGINNPNVGVGSSLNTAIDIEMVNSAAKYNFQSSKNSTNTFLNSRL